MSFHSVNVCCVCCCPSPATGYRALARLLSSVNILYASRSLSLIVIMCGIVLMCMTGTSMLLILIEGVICVLVCVGQWLSAPSMIMPVA